MPADDNDWRLQGRFMNPEPRSTKHRARVWLVFGIVWALIVVGSNSWHALHDSRGFPFKKSYVLGIDEVSEEHRLSNLSWSRYQWSVRFEGEPDTGSPGSRPVRDRLGGDIAVELIEDSGRVVIPRTFVFASEEPSYGSYDSLTYDVGPRDFGFRPDASERFTLRVTTVKTGAPPHPRRVTLSCDGMDAGDEEALMPLWNGFCVAAIIVSAIFVQLFTWWQGRRRNAELREHRERWAKLERMRDGGT